MSLNFDSFSSFDKPDHVRIAKFFHDWARNVRLIASGLVPAYSYRKFSLVFLPLGHGIGKFERVFIFSTWLNNMFLYPRVYYIHVDNTMNNRQAKGEIIAHSPDQITRINSQYYRVKSQSSDKAYNVTALESGWYCTCPDHIYRHVCCKHIHAVEFSIKLRKEVRKQNQVIIEPITYDKCPDCKSSNFVKHGIRHNKNYDLQRYFCHDCSKWFSFNLGFSGIKANPKVVTSAMQLYFTGESLRNVQKFLRLQGVEVSHQTIYNWINKYTGLMQKYLDKITPQVSDTWRADEVFIKVKGNMKYLFALMDDESRFLIAQEVADTKYSHDASSLFRKAKEVAQKKPEVMITDGLMSYHNAYLQEFRTMQAPRTIHIRNITLKGEKNNNKMERINGEIRDREKVTRGLKKNNSPLISGYQIYHNYVRPHMSLDNQTPADRAGIIIKGNDKWRTLIENASLE